MMNQLILAAANTDSMVSGNVIIGVIGAVTTGIALVIGKIQGKKQAREETSTLIEGQPISVAMASKMVTKEELSEMEGRLTNDIRKLENQVHSERGVARTANGNIHARLDKMAEKEDITRLHERIDKQALATAEAAASLVEVKSNVNKLLDLALNPKPRPRA